MAHEELFAVLHKDHEEAADMLDKLEKASTTYRQEYLDSLQEELIPHMKAEEIAFYPLLLEYKESKGDAQKAIDEHEKANSTLKELVGLSITSKDWMSTFNKLKKEIQTHVKNEESKIFSHARAVLTEDQVQSAMTQFNQEKQEVKESIKVRR